jgi:phosphatidate cytidylyltransferase
MNADLLMSGGVAVGSVLASGGVSILAVEVRRDRRLATSLLVRRWLTWFVIAPVWLLASVSPWARALILTGTAVIAVREYSHLRPRLLPADRTLLVALGALAIPMTLFVGVAAFVVVALAASVLPMLSQDVAKGPGRIADQVMGVAVVLVPIALLWEIGGVEGGGVLFALGIAVAMSDVGAFMVGSSIGRSRLAATVSPGKTRAGLVGNLAGAIARVGLTAAIGIISVLFVVSFPLLVAVGAVWGDLLESLFKREAGAKDAGTWLPGFGGLLDRIDSLLVVAPLAYVFIVFIGGA